MVVPVKFLFWFNSYINSQTSVELTTDKMQNLRTKQKPEDAYNTLAWITKKMSLKFPYDIRVVGSCAEFIRSKWRSRVYKI